MLINIVITKKDLDYQVDWSQRLLSSDLYMEGQPGAMQGTPILRTLVEKLSGKKLLINSMQNMYDSESGMLTYSMMLKEIENLPCLQDESITTNLRLEVDKPNGPEQRY